MPSKNIYIAIYKGEDPKHRSTELNAHGPTVKGWQSEKNCEYPQEIVLQLEKRCSITKIQFLAHQYLIRNKKYILNQLPKFKQIVCSVQNRII